MSGDAPARASAAVVLLASAIAAAAAAGSIAVEARYLDGRSRFYDDVYYSYYNARLYARIPEEGRWNIASQEWQSNARHPLRTVPLILLAPGLLAHPMGHVAVTFAAFLSFLALLGWTVWKRSESFLYAAGWMALFASLPIFYHPRQGLAAHVLDLPAALFLGAAALSLLRFIETRRTGWIAGCALFGALTALSRYVGGVYFWVACGPVLAAVAARRVLARDWKGAAVPALTFAAVWGGLAGPFFVGHFRDNVQFYSIYGYALGQPVLRSAAAVARQIAGFFGGWQLAIFAAAAVANTALSFRAGGGRGKLAAGFWVAGSIFLFQTFIVRAVESGIFPVYNITVFFAAAAGLAMRPASARILPKAGVVLLSACLALGAQAAAGHYRLAGNPDSKELARKAFDIELARRLAEQGDRLVWNAYFDEYSWIPTMEGFYRFGRFFIPAGQDYFFSIHETVFKGNYPGLSPEEVAPRIYANTAKWVDIAVVFDEPEEADRRFTNPYSRAAARRVAEEVRRDARWKKIFEIDSPEWGLLSAYRNTALAASPVFSRVLKGQMTFEK